MVDNSETCSGALTRAPSLLLDDYQQNIIIPKEKKTVPIVAKDNATQNQLKKLLSLDDLDLVALNTSFDSQMFLGSPMYFESDEEEEMGLRSITDGQYRDNDDDIHSISSMHYPSGNPFEMVRELREKYIKRSFQDCKSNRKNDLDKWLVYPKPLAKFWKFEKDSRLNETQPSLSDIDLDKKDVGKINKHGYYYPHNVNEEYVPGRKKNSPHFTGEYFNINLYKKENHKNIVKKSLLNHCKENRVIPNFEEFRNDLINVIKICQSRKMQKISEKRLIYLLDKFELFQHLKQKSEILENKQVPYRDFYNSRKVDRDLLLSGCISRRQLSEFIWEKLNNEPDRVVYVDEEGKSMKLKEFFEIGSQLGHKECIPIGLKLIDDDFLEWYKNTYLTSYHLFKSSPKAIRNSLKGRHRRYYLLAVTFLGFDNYIEGEYLAEILTHFSLYSLEKSKYQLAQVSIDYQFTNERGETSDNWWLKFSNWIIKYNLVSYNIRWNIRISRCFPHLFVLNKVRNFQNFLDLIFVPMKEAMNSGDLNFQFVMTNICSFDLVIDETDNYLWKVFEDTNMEPKNWSAGGDNPTISQYMYYICRELAVINSIRYNSFQNTITLRSCPSATSNRTSQFSSSHVIFNEQLESLVCNLLLCNAGLLQGEPLWDAPTTLVYLFFLFQIPVVVDPLSSASTGTNLVEEHQEPSGTAESFEDIENKQMISFGLERRNVSRLINLTVREPTSYLRNPFMKLFKLGFKVSLSSGSILFNSSYTQEPMIEEYSVAASIYLLNAADLCELARNSVLSSGYDGWYKSHWIGVVTEEPANLDTLSEPLGMVDVWYDKEIDTRERHNVPFLRRRYRIETLDQEWRFCSQSISVI